MEINDLTQSQLEDLSTRVTDLYSDGHDAEEIYNLLGCDCSTMPGGMVRTPEYEFIEEEIAEYSGIFN